MAKACRLFAVALLSSLGVSSLWAQSQATTGVIEGTVADPETVNRSVTDTDLEQLRDLLGQAVKMSQQRGRGVGQQPLQAVEVVRRRHQVILQIGGEQRRHRTLG